MIAPESAGGSNSQTGLGALLRRNLLASALVFLVLELWRPCFFLTDDNLDGGYPFFMELGRHLLHGQSPFYSAHLFGGHYDLLRDAGFFNWHPLYLLVALLAGTPLHVLMLDANAFVLFMLATAGFVCLADHVRRVEGVRLSDGWITFFTLSFVYSLIAMATAASWLTFACNQSALPWLALGILQRTWWRGLGLITLFGAHQLLGGHFEPTISTSLVFSLFALGVSLVRGSPRPFLCWVGGNFVAVLLVLPLLLPALHGFATSQRAGGVPLEDMQAYHIAASDFPTALFAGMALWLLHPGLPLAHGTYILALGSSAAIWCLLPALAGRNWRRMDLLVLALIGAVAFLICRPLWVTRIMSHLPLLRSMRWPFRELLQLQFFVHFFLLRRPPGYSPPTRRRIALFSTALFVVPLFLYPLPPTFNAMNWDRRLILSGKVDSYWAQVRPLLRPGDRVAVLISRQLYDHERFEVPYSLLGTYSYACIDGIVNTSGYSSTPPRDQLYTRIAYYPFGAYIPEQRAALLREHPDLKFITLESLQPLKITLSAGMGTNTDLTPFVPRELDPR